MIRLTLFLSLLMAVAASQAQTQLDLNEVSCAEFAAADAELNRSYQDILQRYRGETLFLAKLKTAQRAWIAFRDAELEANYPAAEKQSEYGSIYPMCRCTLLADLTTQRTERLKTWLKAEEGDPCSGSRRP